MIQRIMRLPALAAICVLAGCAATPGPRCAAGEQVSINELVYFGTATPDGEVTAEQWAAFLRDVVTPRFPEGLTTWKASGQWRSADGTLTREDSHVLSLLHPGSTDTELAVQKIVDEYKLRFRQEAVLRVKSRACVSF